uniref:Uncharacterized protein n=1 Tax=Avena sativa TaxID=4498 RepID=A0ACD5TR80_AVESA
MRLAFVLVLAFSAAAVAESRLAFGESTDSYACILKKESLPQVSRGAGPSVSNEKLCQLCQRYSTEALSYLQQKETQAEILSVLNHECAKMGPLRQQCITLVDYYIHILLLEVSVVKPEEFCESAHLCLKGAAVRVSAGGEACGMPSGSCRSSYHAKRSRREAGDSSASSQNMQQGGEICSTVQEAGP